MEILSRELKIPYKEITKRGKDTTILKGSTKEFILEEIESEEEEK